MSLHIVADSSCDLMHTDLVGDSFTFDTVPFTMRLNGVEYVDSEDLNVPEFIENMEACKELGESACPDPHAWLEQFRKGDYVIAVTISSNLSGSFSSAELAKNLAQDETPGRHIEIFDSLATGPALSLLLRRVAEWSQMGLEYNEIVTRGQVYLSEMKTSFALCSYQNLVKNGRMGKLTGFVAKALSMWGIGIATKEGTIAVLAKTKGKNRATKLLLDDMKLRGFKGGDVAISHCQNASLAETLRDMILEKWPNAHITLASTRGLDSFYAERGGLIVSYH